MCISCWLSYVCSSVLAGIAPDRLVFPRHGLTLFLCDQFILVHYWALGTGLTSPVFKEMARVPTVTIRPAAAGAHLGGLTAPPHRRHGPRQRHGAQPTPSFALHVQRRPGSWDRHSGRTG